MNKPKYFIFILFLTIMLVACAPVITFVPTETSVPTETLLPTPLPTSTLISATDILTPLPTQPLIPIFTPDLIQVERWKSYEDALAQAILPMFSIDSILCEWDILARSGQEVYVWAVCTSSNMGDDMRPAVIHLGTDGSVHSVEIPKRGSSSDIKRIFPEEAQTKFSLYTGDSLFNGRLKEMLDHLNYRETHAKEPPLVVLSATPIP